MPNSSSFIFPPSAFRLPPSAFLLPPLELRPQPADVTVAFFGGALGVQGAEMGEDGVIGRRTTVPVVATQPIRLGHGGIELVVEFTQHGDEALLVDEAFFVGQFQGAAICNRRRSAFRVGGTS